MFDRFRTLAPERQFGVAILVLVALTAVLLAGWSLVRTTYRPLFTNLHASDAAAIVAELDRKKASYRLEDDGSTILVPAERVDATRLDLMNSSLSLKGTVGFELFNKSDMGLTDFAQRINYQRALQGELERTLMTFDGVDSARVHLSLGEDRIFREDRIAPKASVSIKMRTSAPLPPAAAIGMQRLIAAAVPRLDPGDVVIVDETGEVVSPASEPARADRTDGLSDEQRAIADYYEARVRAALQPGYPDMVRVRVRTNGSTAHEAGARGADPAAMWNPAVRDFPLQVTLDPDDKLDAAARQDIQGLAAGAISFDASRGDSVVFGAVANPTTVRVAPPQRLAQQRVMTPTPDIRRDWPSAYSMAVIATAIVLLMVAGILIVSRLARGNTRLSPARRERLAAQLKTVLDREEVAFARVPS